MGQAPNEIAESALGEHLKVSVEIRSEFLRHGITEDTESSDQIIDMIRERINNLGRERLRKASVRGKTEYTKTRDYNFYDENFYFMVDIPVYRMENGRRIYYEEAELTQINLENMNFSYNESRDYILPLIRRTTLKVKKILQKPISKILVAGVLFYVFYMVNKNKGLLSIPIKEEDMKNYQFNLITIDTVFAVFHLQC